MFLLKVVIASLFFRGWVSCYSIGVGKADITGPVAEIHLFGYAEWAQLGQGILQRTFARAFIISEQPDDRYRSLSMNQFHDTQQPFGPLPQAHNQPSTGAITPRQNQTNFPLKRTVFVNLDLQSVGHALKDRVIQRLQALYGPDLYTHANVMISSTHTHSAIGGYLEHTLYEIPVKGWLEESVQPIVSGIVKAIGHAHDHLQPGELVHHAGELLDTNINRSPAAYLLNPQSEREQYPYDVDKTMSLLGFHTEKEDLGLISWFAVHGVSVNKTNTLVNGDNKGYAAYQVERFARSHNLSQENFVAAFAQANEGDVSPHTLGSFCTGTDQPCDGTRETKCPWFSTCQGRGPAWTVSDLESNRMIGGQQAFKAIDLYHDAKKNNQSVSGSIDYRQVYWNLPGTKLPQPDGSIHELCLPAMGLGFIAGTTDAEPGIGVYQNTTSMPWYFKAIRWFIKTPSQEQEACHAPKPILFDTGEMDFPHAWQPHGLDIQLLKVGDIYIAGVPAEFTTMSGRRLRKSIKDTLVANGANVTAVILSGPANGYSSYVATYEEYQMQRFEAAATAYGPHTLEGYITVFSALAKAIATGQSTEDLIKTSNLPLSLDMNYPQGASFDFTPRRRADLPNLLRGFGELIQDVAPLYTPQETTTVKASFVAGNPRHNPMLDDTFLTVEQRVEGGQWVTVRTDHDYDTRFRWRSTSRLFGQSMAVIEWEINNQTLPGIYRIGYFGHHKESITRRIIPHYGYSSMFVIDPRLN
ncbi:Neutral/alkaline nonlysosomal ceramidase [Hesseltinella vesiculosa]|uniref:Neutral ceramidase n=1 Tax=Hesseltinella vesiculosa TaxID=101127 RepID=A0A1X2GLK8_9FUNG|nr:Neutral/alkaline nonlysosomal ceramidase [Hesseltinella vesiculosa]